VSTCSIIIIFLPVGWFAKVAPLRMGKSHDSRQHCRCQLVRCTITARVVQWNCHVANYISCMLPKENLSVPFSYFLFHIWVFGLIIHTSWTVRFPKIKILDVPILKLPKSNLTFRFKFPYLNYTLFPGVNKIKIASI
jgi:hypothetical protein